jgi:hypothetical protein
MMMSDMLHKKTRANPRQSSSETRSISYTNLMCVIADKYLLYGFLSLSYDRNNHLKQLAKHRQSPSLRDVNFTPSVSIGLLIGLRPQYIVSAVIVFNSTKQGFLNATEN